MQYHDKHLVIIGNGMAGHRLLESLLERKNRPHRISMIGAEQAPAYNRILLSPWLAGEIERQTLILREAEWYAEQGITLILGDPVKKIDRSGQRIITESGRNIGYDRLVIATGSRPAMLNVPGIKLAGIHGFRDLADADALIRFADNAGDADNRAVVIGGGLLGLEAAEGLRKRGMQVTLLQRSERLMNRQLDGTAAQLLQCELENRGLKVINNARLSGCEGDDNGHVRTLRLEDGRRLLADCVVIAAGIVPNAELGARAGLDTRRGIIVDTRLTTSDPAIHALGECCEFSGNTYGLVEPIWRQVEVLAARLCNESVCNEPVAGYVECASATKLKISGISLYAFGATEPDEDHDILTYHDPLHGDYRRLLLRNNRLEGAVLYGDTTMGPWYFEQFLAERDLEYCRQALLLGPGETAAFLEEAA